MHLDPAVVRDEAKLPEFVHEEAHARPRRADHLCERFLTDLCDYRFWLLVLAEVRKQQKQSGEALFT